MLQSLTPFSDLVDLADMAPFGAEKHVFRWSRQKGKSNMDRFWMISGFFGPPELFLEDSKGFKTLTKNSVKNTGHFNHFNQPNYAFFSWFLNFPHPTNMWWGVENYQIMSKWPSSVG